MNGSDLLDKGIIRAAMNPEAAAWLQGLEIYREIDSTNQHLVDSVRQGLQGPWACLAEYQTAGRGRHGKHWVSPFASGLCLSLLWTFEQDLQHLTGLSLAVGTTITEILEKYGIEGVMLKWPNDIYWSGRKLAGLLIDVVARPSAPTHCVIGVGINICVPTGTLEWLDQPWTDLAATGWQVLSRNNLAAEILSGLLQTARRFEAEGFSPFIDSWRRRDVLAGQILTMRLPGGQVITGLGAGINSQGALQIEIDQEIVCFSAGEVTFLRT